MLSSKIPSEGSKKADGQLDNSPQPRRKRGPAASEHRLCTMPGAFGGESP